jgi:hypothetical protein
VCHYSECHIFIGIIMLNRVSIIMLCDIIVSVLMLCVIMLCVIILSVVFYLYSRCQNDECHYDAMRLYAECHNAVCHFCCVSLF